jgi:hypothetical protein
MAFTLVSVVQLLFTIAVFSLLFYKDNIFFRIATVTALAVGVANAAVFAIESLQKVAYTPLIQGKILIIIPIILGLLIFTTLSTKYSWLSRPSYGFMLAVGIGVVTRGHVLLQIRSNIVQTLKPIIGGRYTPFDNLVSLVMVVTIITYFLVTSRSRATGSLSYVAKFGRYAMMFGMGANYAAATITRFTWLGSRVNWILSVLGLT